MLEVFYENQGSWAQRIAIFDDEAAYMACVPALEAWAEAQGYVLTERYVEEVE